MLHSALQRKPLPTIDISPSLKRDESNFNEGDEVIVQVREACLNKGFFVITGHGIPRELQEMVIEQSRKFFDLCEEEKKKVAATESFGRSHRGYQAVKGERLQADSAPDLKEGYQIGVHKDLSHPDCQAKRMLCGPNVWPQLLEPVFSQVMEEYFEKMEALEDELMKIIALTLGVEYDRAFGQFSQDALRGMRLLHYPPHQNEANMGAGAHTDFGAITVLLTDDVAGLQIFEDGAWIFVETMPGCLIVNLGDMMKRMTAGLYRSSLHRVINVTGQHRYSIPCFLDGNLDCAIDPVVKGPMPESGRLTVEEHMVERFGTARQN